MQRAAAGLAAACADLLGRVYGSRVVLLVGSGDNGGDALYAGARLAHRGAGVTAVLLAPERAHAAGLAALRRAGGRVAGAGDGEAVVEGADLVVDGIVGIGGKGGLRPDAVPLAAAAGRSRGTVVAVDLPSGVDADTGEVRGHAVRADLTVTFGTHKPGLLVDPAREYAGSVRLVDIGLELPVEPELEALQHEDVARAAARAGGGERQVPAGRGRDRRRVGAVSGRRGARRLGRAAGRGRGRAVRRAGRGRRHRAVSRDARVGSGAEARRAGPGVGRRTGGRGRRGDGGGGAGGGRAGADRRGRVAAGGRGGRAGAAGADADDAARGGGGGPAGCGAGGGRGRPGWRRRGSWRGGTGRRCC